MIEYQGQLIRLIEQDTWRIDILKAVRSLNLNDCWVGAGFVRALVWDHLHGFNASKDLADVDVVYYDPQDTSEETEKKLDQKLRALMPHVPWSCKNQARMHLKEGLPAYKDTTDAVRHWPETATAVAVRMSSNDTINILMPFGLKDLFDMSVKPTPSFAKRSEEYQQRHNKKQWNKKWPQLQFKMTKGII